MLASVQTLVPYWKGSHMATSQTLETSWNSSFSNYRFMKPKSKAGGKKHHPVSESAKCSGDVLSVTPGPEPVTDLADKQNIFGEKHRVFK